MNTYTNFDNQLQKLAEKYRNEYISADPFPYIVFHDFFNPEMLNNVLEEFPDLGKIDSLKYDTHNEKKFAGKGEHTLGEISKGLVHFLNSQPFLEFLQELTGIKEILMPDPYLIGGGMHEIKPGGLLKIHADFNKHSTTKLDRRLNVLVYLNKEWEDSYGGHFELWDADMTKSHVKVLPLFNTMAIFSTTDFSFHGHPDALTCPPDRSRKSLALYYYTNGRPANEINDSEHSTLFKARPSNKTDIEQINKTSIKIFTKKIIRNILPPIILKLSRKIFKSTT